MNNEYELEEALAKLHFYLSVSILDDDYKFCSDKYKLILEYVNDWIKQYAKDKSLININTDDILKVKDIFYSIPFKDYKGFYYFEYIDAFIDKIEYYHKEQLSNV